ncbi:hypothetical protein BUALT_Bualt09G0092000 [Buddleja alternifolia]|uniref:Uncharacterized protein n=1 Tax=Buddleja alternifolia TaxID=168488 RepID=A0AAV6X2E3_9LAMI|nr:hypothetical protein BUALT_Bualt09G0092000 [Buddleja alternifolia]
MSATSLATLTANKLQGKVALITRGASGIGEASVKLFTRYGAKYAVDFSVSEYGQLGIMLCNAGISPSFLHTSIFDIEKSHIEKIFDVNVCGAFLGAKHTARVMVPTKIGSIIFTASVTAVIGDKHLWRCRKAWDSSELHLSFFGSNPSDGQHNGVGCR